MKKKSLLAVCLCSLYGLYVVAQDEPANDPFGDPFYDEPNLKLISKEANITKSYSIILEYFSLDLKDAAILMRQNLPDEETYKVFTEKADIEELTIFKACEEKVLTKSISEHIYPTEYEPPIEDTVNLSKIKIIPVTPTAFETRNTGLTTEVKITLLDNGNYHLACFSELVKHPGNLEHGKEPVKATVPIFTTQSLSYNSIISLAKPTLLGTMNPFTDSNASILNKRVWFVVATVKEVK